MDIFILFIVIRTAVLLRYYSPGNAIIPLILLAYVYDISRTAPPYNYKSNSSSQNSVDSTSVYSKYTVSGLPFEVYLIGGGISLGASLLFAMLVTDSEESSNTSKDFIEKTVIEKNRNRSGI